jgi:hypothetical protein
MILDPLPPEDTNPLAAVERRPDETLHAYLLRCQGELSGRIQLLTAVRDAYIQILGIERMSWRRRKALLAFTGPVIAALAYAGFACCAATDSVPIPLMAGLIACAGLASAPLALAMARILDRLPDWMAARRSRRWR